MYLFGVKLLKHKTIFFSLKLIFGLGKFNSGKIIKRLGINSNFKIINITKQQTLNLVQVIKALNIFLTSDLYKFKLSLFKKLLKIKLNKAIRKKQGLPVRGQRTKTNSKTARKTLKF